MSRTHTSHLPVVEWSPSGARAIGASSETVAEGTLTMLAGSAGGPSVVAALSRRTAYVRPIRVPNASAEEVGRAIALQIGQLFPIGSANLAFGFRLTSDVTSEGRLAIVAACSVESMRAMTREFGSVGLHAVTTVPAAFGSPLLAASMGLEDCAVVESTPEGYAIDIVAGGELRASRVVPPVAGTDDLQGEICRTFTIAGLPCGPILAAGGLELAAADHSTSASPLQHLASGAARVGIDLELPEVVAKRSQAAVAGRSRLAIACAIAAVLAIGIVGFGRMTKTKALQGEEALWQKRLRELNANKTDLTGKATKLGQTAGVLSSAFQPAQMPSEILTLVSNAVPKDVWITGVTFERGKMAFVRGAAIRNEAVVDFVNNLSTILDPASGEPRFRDVRIVFANNGKIQDSLVVNFSIQLFPVGNVPIQEGSLLKK